MVMTGVNYSNKLPKIKKQKYSKKDFQKILGLAQKLHKIYKKEGKLYSQINESVSSAGNSPNG